MFTRTDAAAIAALLVGSSLGTSPRVGFNPRDRRVIENKGQALPKGAQKAIRGSRRNVRTSKQRAADELVRISNQTLVVAHLHPRWLRAEVEDLMILGFHVTVEIVDAMREDGPGGATRTALAHPEEYRG